MSTGSQRSRTKPPHALSSLFEEGRFDQFARAYDASPVPELALLRARVFIKREPPAAIEFLLGLGPRKAASPERELLIGTAYGRVGEFDLADEFLARAERHPGAADFSAEILYQRARRLLAENRNAEARVCAVRLAGLRGGENAALHLESAVLSQEGRYRDQAGALVELLRRMSPRIHEGMEMRAWATHTLAALARELYVPEAVPLIEEHLEGVVWPDDFIINRFQAIKSVGWTKALQGDYFNGFRYLKQAADIAPGQGWKVVSHADRAYLARCVNEPRWSRQELDEAEALAAGVDWHATKNEERVALLLLAELFAPIDSSKAAQFLARHSDLPALRSPNVHYRFDDRLQAIADYSTGVVHANAGNHRVALKVLRRSRAAFDEFGYDWRAGRSTLAMFDLTKDPDDLRSADERLRNYWGGWLGEEVKRRAPGRQSVKLPPMQQRIFEAMCRGLTIPQIASLFGRSENTVKNHVKLIFKAFGVRSHAALLAEAVRQRLV